MRRLNWRQVGYSITAVFFFGLLILFQFVQNRAMWLVHPARTYPKHTPDDFNIPNWQSVTFLSGDQTSLVGWFVPPQDAEATVILVHGLNSNRGAMLDQAAVLVKHGYGVLLFDLRGHGESGGWRTKWGATETADIAGAITFLHNQPDVDEKQIAVLGYSMGGAVAIRAATKLPGIQALIVEGTYTSLLDNPQRVVVSFTRLPDYTAPLALWLAEQWAGVEMENLQPVDMVSAVSCPILFIHGTADYTIPAHNSQQLYAAANDPKQLLLIPGAGHTNLFATAPAEMESHIVAFLQQTFGEAGGVESGY